MLSLVAVLVAVAFLQPAVPPGLRSGESTSSQAPALSLCDVARRPAEYEGRSVALRVEMIIGPHGATWFDSACPYVELGGFKWINKVTMVEAETLNRPGAAEPLIWASDIYFRRAMRGYKPSVKATVQGRLIVATDFKSVVIRDGIAVGGGFGDRRAAPFQLRVIHVDSITFQEPRD